MAATQILLATNNRGKLLEMQAILQILPADLVTPYQLGIDLEVEENAASYGQNAALKATAFLQASGMLTLADDSGLEVYALKGQPGIRSARYAPVPNATDTIRRHYLLEQLAGKPRPWRGRFRCAIAIAAPGKSLAFAEGTCPGEIISEERGENGFGYDPIFLLPALGKTMAELGMDEKNLLSHRGRAVRAALPILSAML